MKGELYSNANAEQEANETGSAFMNSHNIMGDLGQTYGASRVSSVNLHSDTDAQQRTRAAGVDAMASGNNIYFGRGAYPANTPASRGLLAHEMTHVMQQQQGRAPRGAAQGGFLDWFQNLFRSNDSQETDSAASETEEEPADINAGPGWKDDFESENEVDESVVVRDTLPKRFEQWAHDSNIQEGIWQNPVFESHAFLPREGIDNRSFTSIHSFIGLRYTTMEGSYVKRYARKRIRVGLGMQGPADNSMLQTDISTETPIKPEKVKAVCDRIEERGNDCYNLLTYNCNHFAKEMAEIAGARLPAQLHDSVLGPAGAYTNIGTAATNFAGKKTLDDTRFFQGGSAASGQMYKKGDFMKSYVSEAKSAARFDMCPFMFHSELRENVERLGQMTAAFSNYYNSQYAQYDSEQSAFQAEARDIRQGVKDVVGTQTFISHPRVNIATLKLTAMVDAMEAQRYPSMRRSESEWTDTEMLASLATQTAAEKMASNKAENGNLTADVKTSQMNAALFSSSSSTEILDKGLCKKCGLDTINETSSVGMYRAAFGYAQGELGNGLRGHLETYTNAQTGLSAEQIAGAFTKRLLTGLFGFASWNLSDGQLLRRAFLDKRGGQLGELKGNDARGLGAEGVEKVKVLDDFCDALTLIVKEIRGEAAENEALETATAAV